MTIDRKNLRRERRELSLVFGLVEEKSLMSQSGNSLVKEQRDGRRKTFTHMNGVTLQWSQSPKLTPSCHSWSNAHHHYRPAPQCPRTRPHTATLTMVPWNTVMPSPTLAHSRSHPPTGPVGHSLLLAACTLLLVHQVLLERGQQLHTPRPPGARARRRAPPAPPSRPSRALSCCAVPASPPFAPARPAAGPPGLRSSAPPPRSAAPAAGPPPAQRPDLEAGQALFVATSAGEGDAGEADAGPGAGAGARLRAAASSTPRRPRICGRMPPPAGSRSRSACARRARGPAPPAPRKGQGRPAPGRRESGRGALWW